MPIQHKVEHLVVDTTAFIKNVNIQDIASNVYTVQGVVDEITNKRQLRRLVVLPYDLKVKDVFPENIKFVTDFSKKTGDYGSLSAVDIQVIALAYQLEKEHVGVEHLHSEPTVRKVDRLSEQIQAAHLAVAGFYMPPRMKEKLVEEESGTVTENDPDPEQDNEDFDSDVIVIEGDKSPTIIHVAAMKLEEVPSVDSKRVADVQTDVEKKSPEVEQKQPEPEVDNELVQEVLQQERLIEKEREEAQAMRDLEEALRKAEVGEQAQTMEELEEALPKIEVEEAQTTKASPSTFEDVAYGTDEEESEEDDDLWDDNAWITPDNIEQVKKDLKAAEVDEGPVTVACTTGDFAMQNVIKQLGMKVMGANGQVIKQMRTHILRCYSCFKTTSKVGVLFCPHCGNRTLHRAAVLLKADGSEEVQISFRRAPTGRGKRFTLPKPQGGKHAINPVLCPDQRMPQQHASRLARTKNNPLEADYIAGYSPFVMRDVTSKSAMLGIRSNHTQVKNWMRKNPNEVIKKGKKKRR